jgi:hypothetical protein
LGAEIKRAFGPFVSQLTSVTPADGRGWYNAAPLALFAGRLCDCPDPLTAFRGLAGGLDRLGPMGIVSQTGRIGSGLAAAAALGLIVLSGCGTPGAPQPPSLKLPEVVTDLTAVRAGDSVTLNWTMPRKTTDHVLLKGQIPVSICWREGTGSCQPLSQTSQAPEAKAEFHGSLPAALEAGDPRAVSLFVELKGPKGRSAGLSDAATILAGAAPGAVTGLSAEVRADGVGLHWNGGGTAPVRLHRKLLTPAAPPAAAQNGPLKPQQEPVLRDLLVEGLPLGQAPGALDRTARFGEVYEYTAQSLIRVQKNGATMELAGANSTPVRVNVIDSFPPAVPQGLAAVYVPEQKTIDLSWEPDTEEDLAGYIVYRADPAGDWKRISGAQPLAGAAYRDASAEPGHSYRYAISAIDQLGHESNRSADAAESVPNP